MKKAYLLIDVESIAKPDQIAELLRHKPYISCAEAVTGPHNIIAVMERSGREGPGLNILTEVREMAGVRYVTACFAIRTEFGND